MKVKCDCYNRLRKTSGTEVIHITVGIIGGGAAGLFAACFLKREGASFTLLEKTSSCGNKLLLTGHGRCNITNRKPPEELKDGYHEASGFLRSALRAFTPDDAVEFIVNELKVPLKEEDNNRMFPVSDKASDIRDALVDYAGKDNIITGFEVSDISREDDRFKVTSGDGRSYLFDRLIVAAGGKSFPHTGSDGNGYELVKRTGHTVTPLSPALTGVPVREEDREFTSSLSGVSVYAGTDLYLDNKKKNRAEGNVLFTHDGLSGPAITELARDIPADVRERDGWIELDFTPGRDEKDVDEELLSKMRIRPDARLTTIGADFVPSSLSAALGERAGVTELRACDVTREERRGFVRELKHLHMSIERQPSFDTAYVTRGGVALGELKRKTFESLIVPGLFIIGEMTDIDGISGGYNLQAAMSEAYVAVRASLC